MSWTEAEYIEYCQKHSIKAEAPRAPTAAREREAKFMAWVIREAKQLGWLVYHTHDSRRSAPGFPDLVLTNGRRTLFAELKTNSGKVTVAQMQWLTHLGHSGQAVHVWRPRHKEMILRCLSKLGDW